MDQDIILLESASNKYKAGDFKEGIHLYSEYLKNNSNDPKAYYLRGKAYFNIKNYRAAISDLNKALSLAPKDAHLISERGLVYFMAKEQGKAMEDFDTALALEPENPFRWASRAFIKDKLNDLEGAKTDYQKAIEIDPEDAISYNNLGMVLEKMGRGSKANELYTKAADLDPKNYGLRESNKSEALPENKSEEPIHKAGNSSAKNISKLRLVTTTLKKLSQSKEERSAFWKFVKEKFS